MDWREVLVLMDQRLPFFETSMTGEETVVAFLSRKFTSKAFRNSSYFSMALYPRENRRRRCDGDSGTDDNSE
jgi:hypothetical protein